MTYFLTGFFVALTQRLRSIKSWLILLLIPLLVFGIQRALPQEQLSAPVLVGVSLPEAGGEEFWNLLNDRSGTVLTFIPADKETIDRNIAAGRWDCGIILADDFTDRLSRADTDRIVTIRVGDGSAVYPLVQEAVAACVANLVRIPIAEDYLADNGMIQSDSDLTHVREQLETKLGPEDRVNITMTTVDGKPIQQFDLAGQGVTMFLRWVIMVTILVWLILCVSDLGKWTCSGAVRRMIPLQPATLIMLTRFSADSLLAIVAGCLGLGLLEDGFCSYLAIIAYVLFWSFFGIILARYRSVWASLPVLPAFAVTASLLFSGVLVDVSTFLPALSGVSLWFPGKLYLRIGQGEWAALLPLIFGAGLCLLLSGVLDKRKKRCV